MKRKKGSLPSGGDGESAEQRHLRRYPALIKAVRKGARPLSGKLIVLDPEISRIETCCIKDVSEGGLQISLASRVPEGTSAILFFSIKGTIIHCNIQVVWSRIKYHRCFCGCTIQGLESASHKRLKSALDTLFPASITLMDEKRAHKRFFAQEVKDVAAAIYTPCQVFTNEKAERGVQGFVRDLSTGGAQILLAGDLRDSIPVRLRIDLNAAPGFRDLKLDLKISVAWSKKEGNNQSRYGVAFQELNDEQKQILSDYVELLSRQPYLQG
ncbi:MAG: PilZ domain-containing protein [Armatimonadetes bacterium]|nr:PilZ domain-containing protein [Armatimonadota bacterium]